MSVYHGLLGEFREHLNALNVYPVPDADTGANLCSTMGGVVDAMTVEIRPESEMTQVCRSIQRGAMLGARGASGVITSQLLGALVDTFDQDKQIDGRSLASGLAAAYAKAYRAVLRPVEGTILTVLREAAEAAGNACVAHDGSLIEVAEACRTAASIALERTPEMLPALKAAGVVDAGGFGLLLFFDALLHVADDRPLPQPPALAARPAVAPLPQDMPRYEVVARLAAPSELMGEFRAVWDRLGNESTVVVEGKGDWVCHIHTDHPEAALEAARAAGVIHDVQVTDLVEQIMQLRTGHADNVAVVAVTVGPGLQERFLEMGATGVVAGGVSKNPSTAELLQAVESTGARTVIILPNDENVIPAAGQVAGLTERTVTVVPSLSIPAGIAALRHFDPAQRDGGVRLMTAAAGSVAAGGVTRAVRDAESPVGRIRAGSWIARSSDGSVSTAPSVRGALWSLLEHLTEASTPARIEVITGDGSDPKVTSDVRRHITRSWPHAEVIVIDGGQPLYPYLVGVEPATSADGR